MATPPGELAVVAHTHLPYLKNHGVWPVGEEWLFEAWAGSWLPLTEMLQRLAADGLRDVLTLGVTPLVAHQVADPRLRRDVGTWIGSQMWRAEEQRSLHASLGEDVVELGTFYWRHYARLLELHERIEEEGGLLTAWAELERGGIIELLGGPATHPYLPLEWDPAFIDAQLACGLDDHARWARGRPAGLWAPEMGYRPRGQVADATATPRSVDRHGTPELPRSGPELPGLEEHYERAGITHFLVDAATLVRAAGGADRDWTRRPESPDPAAGDPYEVVHDGVLVGESDVVAFARDLSVAYHVWSPTAGYPGKAWYRDFHARGSYGVHPSWRVTDKELEPHEKEPYVPDAAAAQVQADVEHFHGVVRSVLDPRPGELVVAAYDTELFGHWWFEGVRWLEEVLRRVAADPALRTTTVRSRLERRPPTRRLELPESSWGYAKGHASWVTPETRPMWRTLAAVREQVQSSPALTTADPTVAAQIARELALASSSDWPFMVSRGKAPDYAHARLREHAGRVRELCDELERGGDAVSLAAAMASTDDAPRDPGAIAAALVPDHNPAPLSLVGEDEREGPS
ncbi:MAG: 1,4-alpha-glucan branching protein domain-containing protein [Nitriliruptorales bacterium]|nr:1,4-alpha-glucan branching protein domain-containing protein [Nitriliruptorales bacterium]